MERDIVVGMADCRTTADPRILLATYALGSCVAVVVYDPVSKVGGLLHFMLPDSAMDPARGQENPYKFADAGIPLLLNKVFSQGASKNRLMVWAVGGAQILDDQGVFQIGKRNCLAARRALWKLGVMVSGEAVGGVDFRTVKLEMATGRLFVEEGGRQRELRNAPATTRGIGG
ncbi:MAG TPA: chemotaxis protein CheD [Bryobacteraceae bacterium]|nr:chemotaxis protein CheD [Bryobacteraceae bacterium]